MREQAAIGMTANGGLDRLTLTDTDREVRDWFRAEMVDAGLNVRVDENGKHVRPASGHRSRRGDSVGRIAPRLATERRDL